MKKNFTLSAICRRERREGSGGREIKRVEGVAGDGVKEGEMGEGVGREGGENKEMRETGEERKWEKGGGEG